jgi:hypothetical protein
MIYDNSTGDTFTQFYNDDPLGFLNKRSIDTVQARKEIRNLRKTLAEIDNVLDRVENSDGKTDLWSRYTRGEFPHIHCSEDPYANVFMDALSIQADRIRKNIKKKYTISDEEINNLMFGE